MSATRDSACATVASEELLALRPTGCVAVIDETTGQVADALSSVGASVVRWITRGWDGLHARAEPIEGPWDGAVLRLPRERARLALTLDLAAGRMAPGAPLWVVGGNDEGIKSTANKLGPLFEGAETVTARKHCRLVVARRSSEPARGTLMAWESRQALALPGVAEPVEVVSVPGVFAKGGLDAATALLLTAVADRPLTGPCLDFACGIGLIALGVSRLHPGLSWTLTDVDAWSLHCARRNLSSARFGLGHGWAPVPTDAPFGTILSNPPLHRGVGSDRTTLDRLIAQAPARLAKGGHLVVVSQGTAGVGKRLKATFGASTLWADDGRFQVWAAQS